VATAHCRGVDFSDYLIQVAKENFERLAQYSFLVDDARHFVENEQEPERFTKVLCFGAFQYLPAEDANTVLSALDARFANVNRIYIGRLPDRSLAWPEADFSNHESDLGRWFSLEEFEQSALDSGWRCEFSRVPLEGFEPMFRFDVVLHRPS
jgi:hypothetical protein